MRGPHNIWRLVRTGATLERTGAMNVVLDAFDATPALRFVAKALGKPFKFLGYAGDPSMPPATRALTALGPAYIKFGQVLSTRPDVVGDELAVQLRVLQDKLPPFSIEKAKAEVEKEFGICSEHQERRGLSTSCDQLGIFSAPGDDPRMGRRRSDGRQCGD